MSYERTPESILKQKITRSRYEINRMQRDTAEKVAERYAYIAECERQLAQLQHPSNGGGSDA